MRTRPIPQMLNSEVQEYLKRNDIVIVPVGTIGMHGGLPMDYETVLPEAIALKNGGSLRRPGAYRTAGFAA